MIHALNPARKTNKPAKGRVMMARIRTSSESRWRPGESLAAMVITNFQGNLFQARTHRFRAKEAAGLLAQRFSAMLFVAPLIEANGISNCKEPAR
jgi:hypothetical protein